MVMGMTGLNAQLQDELELRPPPSQAQVNVAALEALSGELWSCTLVRELSISLQIVYTMHIMRALTRA